MVEKTFASAKSVKEGKYIIIDDIPCKVVKIETSRPGKHGHAKMKITGIGVFSGQKKMLFVPGHDDIEVPIIERKTAQIVSVSGETAQLMDKKTYEVYDIKIPDELKDQVEAGKEADIMEAMGKKLMTKVKE